MGTGQFTLTGSTPVADVDVLHVAQAMSMLDPRCDWPCHNRVALGEPCPRCNLDLGVYQAWIAEGLGVWPL